MKLKKTFWGLGIRLFIFSSIFFSEAKCAPAKVRSAIEPLVSIAKEKNISIWIDYHGSCYGEENRNIDFDLKTDAVKNKEETAENQIRDTLKKNRSLMKYEVHPQIIRATAEGTWLSIMNVSMSGLILSDTDRYNPTEAIDNAIDVVISSPQGINIDQTPKFYFHQLSPVSQEGTHLDAGAQYLNMEDFLYKLTLKFKGVIVYRECLNIDNLRMIDINFYATG